MNGDRAAAMKWRPRVPWPPVPGRGRFATIWLLLLALAPGCGGDDSTAPPPPPPALQLTIADAFIGPREQTRITVEVTPIEEDPIVEAWLLVESGGARDSLEIPFSGDQPQGVYLDLTVPNEPISATLHFTADVRSERGARAQAAGVLRIGDETPPATRWTYVGDTVYVGRTAAIGATYYDRSGLAREELHLSGAMERHDVIDLEGFPTDGAIAFEVVVPEQPGDSIVQRAVAVDMYGLTHEIRQVYHIAAAP